MDLIFNELSFRDLSTDLYNAKVRMSILLHVCKEGREIGMNRLAVRPDFREQYLFANYSVTDWLNDSSVSFTLKNLLLAIVRYPYIDSNDQHIETQFISSYTFLASEDTVTEGLAVAYLYNTIAISLSSAEIWSSNEIALKFSGEGFEDQRISVKHASQTDHIKSHQEWIGRRVGIKLVVTELNFSNKEINLRDDHGKDVLQNFSRKIVRSQYIVKVINSLPFNPRETNFIRSCSPDGKIEIVLVRSDQGLGLVIQSTGRNLSETQEIAKLLEHEFSSEY